MAKLKRGKKQQPSSRPEGWLAAGIVVPVNLTVRQERYAKRCLDISRFVYNLATSTHRFHRRNRLAWPSAHEMAREFNAAKREDYPFATEVSKFVAQGAFRNFGRAIARWRDPEIKSGPPAIRRKNRTGAGSFLAASGINLIKYDGHRRIKLPYLGSVKLARELPEGIAYEVTVKHQNGRWYASIAYWKPRLATEDKTHDCGGVDVGINPLAVDSAGAVYENPRAYYKAQRKLRRWQRAQARRATGSRGWREAQSRIDTLHRRVSGLRNDAHHQVSRTLVRKFQTLGIETLNVAGMDQLRHQAKAIRDAAIGGLLQKISYKAGWYGTTIIAADRWFPSSKTCSECGVINTDLKREPHWTCPNCGVCHDRNLNAARNLHKLALLAVGEDVTLPDGKALAGDVPVASETAPDDGRTRPATLDHTQLRLAL